MKKIPVEKVILFLAAGFAAYNFGLAGGYIEHGAGIHFSIGGLAAGIVVNVSLAIAASRYGSLKGEKRTRQAQAAFLTMLVLSPILVSPMVYYSLPETFLGAWWLRALWSVAWPLVADLAIVLAGAVSGRGLIALSGHEQAGGASGKQGVQVAPAMADKLHLQVARKADKLHLQVARKADKQPVQDEALLAIWRDKPEASDRQVAVQFGTSRQAIQQRREKLIKQGAIMMTDKGVEIIGISVTMPTGMKK